MSGRSVRGARTNLDAPQQTLTPLVNGDEEALPQAIASSFFSGRNAHRQRADAVNEIGVDTLYRPHNLDDRVALHEPD
jgi:hypothetical protein